MQSDLRKNESDTPVTGTVLPSEQAALKQKERIEPVNRKQVHYRLDPVLTL